MSYLLGLTGSIGMGKSTTAALFAARGCLIWDADLAVHRAYNEGGDGVAEIRKIAITAVDSNSVNRDKLRTLILEDPTLLAKIEAIIHPIVQKDRQAFIASNPGSILVFDIPLLFELNSESDFDAVACVLSTFEMQKTRVMARPGMTRTHLEMIISKQLPAADKAARANYIINTATKDIARAAVDSIIKDIKRKLENA
jgi:dephospho-CoA kinase|tara:strand:- start:721 stop:1314 length:594 start_codon:yes stop_codon:yes gene_type:complete